MVSQSAHHYRYLCLFDHHHMWCHQAKPTTWVFFFCVHILNNVFCKFDVIPVENDFRISYFPLWCPKYHFWDKPIKSFHHISIAFGLSLKITKEGLKKMHPMLQFVLRWHIKVKNFILNSFFHHSNLIVLYPKKCKYNQLLVLLGGSTYVHTRLCSPTYLQTWYIFQHCLPACQKIMCIYAQNCVYWPLGPMIEQKCKFSNVV